jgi:hypothetical protein
MILCIAKGVVAVETPQQQQTQKHALALGCLSNTSLRSRKRQGTMADINLLAAATSPPS